MELPKLKEPEHDYSIGDVLTLRSGNTKVTVEDVGLYPYLEVVWFDSEETLNRDTLHYSCTERIH
jgi:uncharacterized protein YodC (DUF2158 family)